MTERLLQYLWQFQYFNKSSLETATGEQLDVIAAGQINYNQGPDFLNAKIKIDQTVWAGSVELHLRTSDWEKHKHEADRNYQNVILHVVWENDKMVNDIPVLELKDRVAKVLLKRYDDLMSNTSFIPCENIIHTVPAITWNTWKERLLAERLLRKANYVEGLLQKNNFHWEETFWWMLARNFGIFVNADAFEEMARSIPVNILAKHKNSIHQVEALLFGQAGLLTNDFLEDYPMMLKKEYDFLRKKYALKSIHQPVHFLRIRPGSFPTIRLAQLAALITNSVHLFSKIKEAKSVKEIKEWFNISANDYWHYHYRFDDPGPFREKKIGAAMADNIIINTIAPVIFSYGNYNGENKYKDKALLWLEETAPEKNSITKGFEALEIEHKTAYDSQALIELKNEYCNKKRCLECSVGNSLLRNS